MPHRSSCPIEVRLGNHPASDSHIPVSLYGDEVVVNRQGDSITAIYLSLTLWKPKRVRCTHYQVFAMRSHRITLWPILGFIAQSLNKAFDGCGKSGCKFSVSELKGDWVWLRKVLRLGPSYTGNHVCFLCHATVHLHSSPFWDMEGNNQEVSTENYLATMMDPHCSPSPLVLIIGFCPGMIQVCSMHTVNLGLCFTTNGALLCTLLRNGFYGPSNDALNKAFADFTCWRKSMGVRSSQWRFKVDGVSVTRCRPKTQPGPLPYS